MADGSSPQDNETRQITDSKDNMNGKESENELEKAVQESSTTQAAADVPPDGGYGWVIVLGAALINAHSWGINSSYGVFLAYYLSHNTFPGASYLDFAFVGGLSISMALLIAPIATNTTRIFSTRTTLLIGVFFETVALIGASFATQIWHLFLSQGVCFGWGVCLHSFHLGLVPPHPQTLTLHLHRWDSSSSAALASSRSGLRRAVRSPMRPPPEAPASAASSTRSRPTPSSSTSRCPGPFVSLELQRLVSIRSLRSS
ncbi:hypothetical protein FH972_022191 [Carpinus fangiana]|uniref:Major facilitator superfamily (MFS) profile domain-containing protein n=1 Tax=Carpinus fangiana TaxID=176857 RepID=A0A5N6KRV9_9ROSI|nr:hypothetical protein FH972_022191 [Carpinus fangiana]